MERLMISWSSRWTRRLIKVIVCLLGTSLVLHSLQVLDISARRFDVWEWNACPGLSPFDPSCPATRVKIAQDVQVVIKTGGSEPQGRLRTQLSTILSTVPKKSLVIFSDMEENVGPHKVHDVYSALSKRERERYPEFALYEAQQIYLHRGEDTRSMSGGWELAKYMNLAMLRKIRAMQQDLGPRKWYIFLDTDTFVNWDNMFALLEHLDSEQRMYVGSPVWLPGLQFAHGGSAYALSSAALDALDHPAIDPEGPFHSQFGYNTTELCCGDEALARVLKKNGVRLKGYWPMLNGEVPGTLSFGQDLWCEPVISLHHLGESEMERLWQWLEEWKVVNTQRPLLFQDLFQYIGSDIPSTLEDWHSIDERTSIMPKQKSSHRSFEHCERACQADVLCMQFVHDGESCTLSHHIRLGHERAPEVGRRFISGWKSARIEAWAKKNQCKSAHWLRSNP